MYTDYYGLNSRPFENTPDPRFLFLSTQHREVLSSLIYGINSAKGFILVAGGIGTGKTTLLHCLLKEISSSHIIINIINPRAVFNDLVLSLSKRLGVECQGKDALERSDALKRALEKQDKAGKRVILIIDEAHLLSDESLEDIRLLSNLETDRKKLIQIILAGQNEIHKTLAGDSQKPLKQRIILNRQLEPLDGKETEEYIKHRLKVAGDDGNLFSAQALNLIKKKSRGTPRVINQICDNALLIGYATEARTIGAKIIKEVIKDMESRHSLPWHRPISGFFMTRWAGAAAGICLLMLSAAWFLMANPSESLLEPDPAKIEAKSREEIITDGQNNRVQMHEEKKFQAEEVVQEVPINSAGRNIDLAPDQESHNSSLKSSSLSDNETDIDQHQDAPVETVGETRRIEIMTERVKMTGTYLKKPGKVVSENIGDTNSKTRKILPNEWLTTIARNEYGIKTDTIIDFIHMANPGIKNVNCIYAGQKIILPEIKRDDLIVSGGEGAYHIHYASFYNFSEARHAAGKLLKQGLEAFVMPSHRSENITYQVYVGIFTNRDDAAAQLHNLELKYISFLDKK